MITNTVQHLKQNDKGFRIGDRKDNLPHEKYSVCTIEKGQIEERIDVRVYFSKSKVYAAIWVRPKKAFSHPSGTGWASGYGYDKPSAAIQQAFRAAGYQFEKSFGGVGQQGIEAALKAVAEFHKMGKITIMRHYA